MNKLLKRLLSPGPNEAGTATTPPRGSLLGWGDSWLCYRPASQIFRESNLMKYLQEDGFTLAAQPFAQAGTLLATMASRPLEEPIYDVLDDLLARNAPPQAILLSGSGNDCVKTFLLQYIAQKGNGSPIIDAAWKAHRDVLRGYFITILAKFKAVASRHGATVPVLVHGYDHPTPDGRFLFPGLDGRDAWIFGWLVTKLNYTVAEATTIMHGLIDGLNETMATLPNDPAVGKVVYVKLSGTLKQTFQKGMSDADWFTNGYKTAWDNELHPTPDGFRALASKVASALDTIPVPGAP